MNVACGYSASLPGVAGRGMWRNVCLNVCISSVDGQPGL